MRRRARRFFRRAGLLAPALAVCAVAAQAMPPVKDDRDRETARAQGRIVPMPGDVAPADPVAAAFSLFPGTREERREEVVTSDEASRTETLPMPPPPIVEVEPGVVAVERATAFVASEPPAMVMAYAVPTDPAPLPAERVFTPPSAPAVAAPAARAFNVPLPRRRPADLTGPAEPALRLAGLTPEPVRAPAEVAAPIAREAAVFGEPKRIPKEALPHLAVLRREAAANKVPLWLAVGVGWVESKYDPNLRGSHGVVGLMQVMPSTARFQGYRGPPEKLLEPETNIVWGMKELGWDWAKSGGDPCLAIAKYKGGIATNRISAAAADYCRRAKTVTGMM